MKNNIPNTPEDVPFGSWNPFATPSTPSGASSRRLDRRTASRANKESAKKRKGMIARRTSFIGGKDE